MLTQKPVSHDCSKETMNLMRKDHRSEGKRKGCFFSCVKPHPLDLQRKKRKPTPLEPEGGNTWQSTSLNALLYSIRSLINGQKHLEFVEFALWNYDLILLTEMWFTSGIKNMNFLDSLKYDSLWEPNYNQQRMVVWWLPHVYRRIYTLHGIKHRWITQRTSGITTSSQDGTENCILHSSTVRISNTVKRGLLKERSIKNESRSIRGQQVNYIFINPDSSQTSKHQMRKIDY